MKKYVYTKQFKLNSFFTMSWENNQYSLINLIYYININKTLTNILFYIPLIY